MLTAPQKNKVNNTFILKSLLLMSYFCSMHYVSVTNLTKAYGIKPLFQNLSFDINEGDKIALIAKNGSGKTTLLNILAGKDVADSGKNWVHKDVTVAFFEQEPLFDEDKSINDNIFKHDHPIINAIKKYELASEGEDIDEITSALEAMDEFGAWDFDAKVKQILSKLKIDHLSQNVNQLSGGQRKRVALAKTLIDIGFDGNHTMLIMDEPTNHLDVAMVEWLEYFLSFEKVTLLLVTHDRYFLDEVCNVIWELDGSEIFIYKGDYNNYLEKKAARIENDLASIDKAKNTFRKELEWMRKQPKARTTKSKSRQDAFYEIEAKAKQQIVDDSISLQMKMNRLGGKVVEMKKVYKAFGDLKILAGFDYNFKKGQRVGIVGKNGAGKSTFINILQTLEPVDSGKIVVGDTVVFGYYSQQNLVVKEDMRVIEFVKNIAEHFPLADGSSLSASQFLQLFLFSPDQQFTYISKLSGGEKRRLHLITILFKNPNVLILDEPTNDLDLQTLAVLENFLQEFGGVLIMVSHDRYFMDKLVDNLLVFEGQGEIWEYPGNYTQYRLAEIEKEKNKGASKNAPKEAPKSVAKEAVYEKKKMTFNDKREFENIEKELPKLEKEKERINAEINAEGVSYDVIQVKIIQLGEVSKRVEQLELRWLELSEMA
jgi:ABC transport system ATP-binding/permease protein